MAHWAWLGWIVLLLVIGIAGWAGWVFYNARRQGFPAPPLKSYIPFVGGGRGQSSTNYPSARARNPIEWVKDQIAKLRNRRTHEGAYEESSAAEQGYGNISGGGGGSAGATRGGRGRGLEDDAWDTRVGNEDPYGGSGHYGGQYEEQELGLAATPGYTNNEAYGRQGDYLNQSTTYDGASSTTERGRTLTTQHSRGGDNAGKANNPFGDEHAAPSLRSMSPRPAEIDTSGATTRGHKRDTSSLDSTHSSPTSVRKSHFSEAEMR